MIDRIFFSILLVLPVIASIAALLYAKRAYQTRTPRVRRSRVLAALWLAACVGIMLFCRERVRGWTGFDNAAALITIGTAASLVVLGALLGFMAVFGRSTRGRPLCPRCWYDMEGVEPDESGRSRCPECGLAVDSQLDLVRRKRWPIAVAVAVVCQLAGQLSYQVIRADHGGPLNFIPTTILVGGMFSLPAEFILAPSSPLENSALTGRLTSGRTAQWQRSWAIRKAIDAISSPQSAEAVARGAIILNRCEFEGEIPLSGWIAALRKLCESPAGSGEAFSYLAECYTRIRGGAELWGRITLPNDPALSAAELQPLVPALIEVMNRTSTRGQQWWTCLRLLALAGEPAPGLIALLQDRMIVDETDAGRASAAAALAMLSIRFPDAPLVAVESWRLLPETDQPRVLGAIVRYVDPLPSLLPTFEALADCGEPPLEVLGATALTGNDQTRCRGADLLIRAIGRSVGPPDFSVLYWPIARRPDDDASTVLISYLKRTAMEASPRLRAEAMSNLGLIGRDFESRSQEIVLFLDYLALDLHPELAERARSVAAEVRGARGPLRPLRKVAVLR